MKSKLLIITLMFISNFQIFSQEIDVENTSWGMDRKEALSKQYPSNYIDGRNVGVAGCEFWLTGNKRYGIKARVKFDFCKDCKNLNKIWHLSDEELNESEAIQVYNKAFESIVQNNNAFEYQTKFSFDENLVNWKEEEVSHDKAISLFKSNKSSCMVDTWLIFDNEKTFVSLQLWKSKRSLSNYSYQVHVMFERLLPELNFFNCPEIQEENYSNISNQKPAFKNFYWDEKYHVIKEKETAIPYESEIKGLEELFKDLSPSSSSLKYKVDLGDNLFALLDYKFDNNKLNKVEYSNYQKVNIYSDVLEILKILESKYGKANNSGDIEISSTETSSSLIRKLGDYTISRPLHYEWIIKNSNTKINLVMSKSGYCEICDFLWSLTYEPIKINKSSNF